MTDVEASSGVRVEEVHFHSLRAAGCPEAEPPLLAGTFFVPTPASSDPAGQTRFPGLVVGHGAGSNRHRHASFCQIACTVGMTVLSIDFRGHGESTGLVDGPLEADVVASAAVLRRHPSVHGGPIGYRGSSMGGFYGLRAAPEAAFAALCLLCPASEAVLLRGLTSFDEDTLAARGLSLRADIEALRAWLEASDSLAVAARVSDPVLLVHARGDDVVPLDHSLALAAALAGPVETMILPGGGHGTAQASPELHRRTSEWLVGRLREARRE